MDCPCAEANSSTRYSAGHAGLFPSEQNYSADLTKSGHYFRNGLSTRILPLSTNFFFKRTEMNNNCIMEHLENELKESLVELRSATVPTEQRLKAAKLSYDRILIVISERKGEKKISPKQLETLRIDCGSQEGTDSSADSGFSSPDSPVGNNSDIFFGKAPVLSPSMKKSPFEKYSTESAFRQRAVSECVSGSPNRRGILKMPSVDDVSHRVKRVSICEEHNQLVRFNPGLSLDQQASQRRKNEKKRLQKQRKADEKQHSLEREDSVDPICSDYEEEGDHVGKRSDRQDSGFISDDEDEKVCA